jgi:formiminoglutamase
MLPVLLSIPHGGTQVPEEVRDRVCITPRDLFDDSDACTADIYDLGSEVRCVVKSDIARAFVDLNRAPDDRPPENADGVVKTATCFKRPIYLADREVDTALTERLLTRYHMTYHDRLHAAAADPGIALALDCHSMLAAAPPISSNPGQPRPLFCLSNRDGATAPNDLLLQLAEAIGRAFDISAARIGLNDPFKGGYITQRHGCGRLPWIQVEMNRALYLAGAWFDADRLRVDPGRLAELREQFRAALRSLKF